MKDEEFNDFLRDRAGSFEMKPSSGSFDAVMGKMQRKRRRLALWAIPLLTALVALPVYFFSGGGSGQSQQAAAPVGEKPAAIAGQDTHKSTGNYESKSGNTLNMPSPATNPVTKDETPASALQNNEEILPVNAVPDETPVTGPEPIAEEKIIRPLLTLTPIAIDTPGADAGDKGVLRVKQKDTLMPLIAAYNKAEIMMPYRPFRHSFALTASRFGSGSVTLTKKDEQVLPSNQKTINVTQGGVPSGYSITTEWEEPVWNSGFGVSASNALVSRNGVAEFSFGLSFLHYTANLYSSDYARTVDTLSVPYFDTAINSWDVRQELITQETPSSKREYTTTLNIVKLPIMLTLYPLRTPKLRLYTQCGISIDYVFSNTLVTMEKQYSLPGNLTTADNIESEQEEIQYRKWNQSLMFGTGVDINLTRKTSLMLGVSAETPLSGMFSKSPEVMPQTKPFLWGAVAGIKIRY